MQKRYNRLISSYIDIITRNHPKKAKKTIYGILPKHLGSNNNVSQQLSGQDQLRVLSLSPGTGWLLFLKKTAVTKDHPHAAINTILDWDYNVICSEEFPLAA